MAICSESEIFSKLEDSFSEAASLCTRMAASPLRGAAYGKLINVCDEIEAACRQAGYWRENYEWFVLGGQVHELQRRMGNWIRALYPKAQAKELFAKAALKMQAFQRAAERKRMAAHGRTGMILPEPEMGVGPSRQRAVQVPRTTPAGLFLPEGVTLQ